MCGRMTQQTDPSEVARIFDAEIAAGDRAALAELGPRYNVAPTQPLVVVVERDAGRVVEQHRWGIVPAWAEAPGSAGLLINARAETIDRSPAFRASFRRRRCLIPADGFYEWRTEGRIRQPYLIGPRDGRPLAMAGIWSPWREPASGEWLLTAAVVTTVADATVGRLHDRMPVLLPAAHWSMWLDSRVTDRAALIGLLQPAAAHVLDVRPVSRRLNSAQNEGADLLVADVPAPDAGQPPLAEPLRLFD